MSQNIITAVGIDVSKAKSIVVVRRPEGEVILMPFQVDHTVKGIQALIKALKSIGGDIRVVVEHTNCIGALSPVR